MERIRSMSKKNKFDLTKLAHMGLLKEGDSLLFVSDNAKTCSVHKSANGEYKVLVNNQETTIHAFVKQCLGEEPPIHATKWLTLSSGKPLYDIWQSTIDELD